MTKRVVSRWNVVDDTQWDTHGGAANALKFGAGQLLVWIFILSADMPEACETHYHELTL